MAEFVSGVYTNCPSLLFMPKKQKKYFNYEINYKFGTPSLNINPRVEICGKVINLGDNTVNQQNTSVSDNTTSTAVDELDEADRIANKRYLKWRKRSKMNPYMNPFMGGGVPVVGVITPMNSMAQGGYNYSNQINNPFLFGSNPYVNNYPTGSYMEPPRCTPMSKLGNVLSIMSMFGIGYQSGYNNSIRNAYMLRGLSGGFGGFGLGLGLGLGLPTAVEYPVAHCPIY